MTENFLQPVVEDVCKSLNILDASGNLALTDSAVVVSVKMAGEALSAYCNRHFEKGSYITFIEVIQPETRLKLAERPIESITEVMIDDEASSASILSARTGLIKLEKLVSRGQLLSIKYIGGIQSINDHPRLKAAITQQAIAIYNQRTSLGLTSASLPVYNGPDVKDVTSALSLLPLVKRLVAEDVFLGWASEPV